MISYIWFIPTPFKTEYMSAYVNTPKHSLQNKFEISMRNIPENGGKQISIFCAAQFQFDVIYSMTLDFDS